MAKKLFLIITMIFCLQSERREVLLNQILYYFPDSESPTFFTAAEMLQVGGKIYIVDNLKHKIRVFSEGGKFLFNIGRRGLGPGDLYLPGYISEWKGIIAIKDQIGISFFDLNGNFLRKFRLFWRCLGMTYVRGRIYCISVSPNFDKIIKTYREDGKEGKSFLEKGWVLDFVDFKKLEKKEDFASVEDALFRGELLSDGKFLFYVNFPFGLIFKFDLEGNLILRKSIEPYLNELNLRQLEKNKKKAKSGKILKGNIIKIWWIIADAYFEKGKIYIMETPKINKKEKKILFGKESKILVFDSLQLKNKRIYKLKKLETERPFSFAVAENGEKIKFYIAISGDRGNVVLVYQAKRE